MKIQNNQKATKKTRKSLYDHDQNPKSHIMCLVKNIDLIPHLQ